MTLTFDETATKVPIAGGRTVTIESGQPWPSAYRGSRYSLVSDDDFDDPTIKWKQRDLTIYAESDPPSGLRRAIALAGKTGGYGSFRVTAKGEVITKVEAEEDSDFDQAPVSSGWVPVYLGQLDGEIDFGSVDLNPAPPNGSVAVWRGLPFNHGERWSVSHDGELVWNWRDYRFESAFDHAELVDAYDSYRPNPGRLYVTEHGHVWVNVPNDDIVRGRESEIRQAVASWKERAESNGNSSTLRLVNRRMVATSQSEDPSEGHLPIHLGHLSQFDGGVVPRPVVDDESYYLAVGEYERTYE
jgi:hypothetical protein